MNDDEEQQRNVLIEKINAWRNARYGAQRKWSAVHHFVLFGSIISSVLAGALIQMERSEVAMILTTIAAVLTGIAASGGFERKWKSNRLSRSRADCLLLELDDEKADISVVRQKLADAIEKHDYEVVDEKNGEHPA